jgi:putative phosphonate metabolism protein
MNVAGESRGPRYALYFAPAAHHPLWTAGCRWLGRDPESGTREGGGPHRADPCRYGFHATLKPPFALREGLSRGQLLAALSHFVDERTPFPMPALQVATLGDFLALRPVEAGAAAAGQPLRDLADDCVRLFDDFRRPATAEETARRLAAGLDAPRRENVARWGYPHVFEQWRFHMTLSDPLPRDARGGQLRDELLDTARREFAAALAQPLRCDGVALFGEDAPGADFRLVRRFDFAR